MQRHTCAHVLHETHILHKSSSRVASSQQPSHVHRSPARRSTTCRNTLPCTGTGGSFPTTYVLCGSPHDDTPDTRPGSTVPQTLIPYSTVLPRLLHSPSHTRARRVPVAAARLPQHHNQQSHGWDSNGSLSRHPGDTHPATLCAQVYGGLRTPSCLWEPATCNPCQRVVPRSCTSCDTCAQSTSPGILILGIPAITSLNIK